jgi:predicted nucleotidyltransferase
MVLSVQKIIDNMAVVAKEYPIERAELFGSYANGQSTAASDVDIIMEFSTPQVSLLMLNDIRYRLEELLQTKVDLVHGPLPADGLLEIDRRITLYGA